MNIYKINDLLYIFCYFFKKENEYFFCIEIVDVKKLIENYILLLYVFNYICFLLNLLFCGV